MQLQSKNPVYARAITASMLSALSAVPGAALLVTPFVHLFTAGPSVILPTSVPGDFTEATFVGYAPVALTLPLVGPIQIDNADLARHNEVDFLAGAVVPPGENILGYWVDEAAVGGATFYFGEVFETPVPIAALGDYISLDVAFPLRQNYQLLT
jgi:hypothetical protein